MARMLVEHSETSIKLDQEYERWNEMPELTTRQPEERFEEMWHPIGDSLRDLASSNNQEDREDEDEYEEDTELRMLSNNDKPGWEMRTIFQTVQHCIESSPQRGD